MDAWQGYRQLPSTVKRTALIAHGQNGCNQPYRTRRQPGNGTLTACGMRVMERLGDQQAGGSGGRRPAGPPGRQATVALLCLRPLTECATPTAAAPARQLTGQERPPSKPADTAGLTSTSCRRPTGSRTTDLLSPPTHGPTTICKTADTAGLVMTTEPDLAGLAIQAIAARGSATRFAAFRRSPAIRCPAIRQARSPRGIRVPPIAVTVAQPPPCSNRRGALTQRPARTRRAYSLRRPSRLMSSTPITRCQPSRIPWPPGGTRPRPRLARPHHLAQARQRAGGLRPAAAAREASPRGSAQGVSRCSPSQPRR